MIFMGFLLLAASDVAQPLRLQCNFTGEDESAPDLTGPRTIDFVIGVRGSKVKTVEVADPTGIFTSGNIVATFSTVTGVSRVKSNEDPRWRGQFDAGRLTLTGLRREVSLTSDRQNPASWSGRLRYDIGGGRFTVIKDGELNCKSAASAGQTG